MLRRQPCSVYCHLGHYKNFDWLTDIIVFIVDYHATIGGKSPCPHPLLTYAAVFSRVRRPCSLAFCCVSPSDCSRWWTRLTGCIMFTMSMFDSALRQFAKLIVWSCRNGSTSNSPSSCTTDSDAHQRLRSASSTSLVVRRTRLSTVADRGFSVAGPRMWNSCVTRQNAERGGSERWFADLYGQSEDQW